MAISLHFIPLDIFLARLQIAGWHAHDLHENQRLETFLLALEGLKRFTTAIPSPGSASVRLQPEVVGWEVRVPELSQ